MRKLALALSLVCLGAQAQVTCQQIGQFTYCSDGTTYNRIGNNTYGSDGSVARRIGNNLYLTPGARAAPMLPALPQIPFPQADTRVPMMVQPVHVPRCGWYNGQYVCI